MNTTTSEDFRLSDPGIAYSESDSDLIAYLQCYGLPYPPLVRYGNLFFDSPQANHRVKIFGQAWVPNHPIGIVMLVHGFAEHSGNYSRLIRDFLKAHFAVTTIDLRGHGISEGTRGHTDTPDCYSQDIEKWMNIVYPNIAPSVPIYLWGHSLGAQICLQLIVRKKLPRTPAAACLTSPMLGFPKVTGIRKALLRSTFILAKLFPALQVPAGIQPSDLSTDKEYLAKRREDPLIHSVVTPGWVECTSRSITKLVKNAADFKVLTPVLCLLAGEERVADLLAARSFAFDALSSLRHKVIEFPEHLHELEKDSVRERVVTESLAWFRSHRK